MSRQRALAQALDRAEEVMARAQQRPPARRVPLSEEKSLHDKLYDIYVEECGKEPEATDELTTNVNLLEKLVSRESLPCLVFNLYPREQGYSIMLDDKSGSLAEPISLPYQEDQLLEYLDAQQLPPVLLDVLDTSQINIFHSGCVIAEIRDYRQCVGVGSAAPRSKHVLLRPTLQTLVCGVEAIVRDSPSSTQQEKPTCERQLTLPMSEPVFLDPSVAVACTDNRLLFTMHKMNTAPMQQCFKRHLQPNLSLLHELSQCSPPPDFRVLTICKKMERNMGQEYNLRITSQNYVDTWKQRRCDLTVPSEIDVEKYAKGKEGPLPGDVPRHCWPPLVMEYDSLFEYEPEVQPWETDPSIVLTNDDPLWCDMVDPPKFSTLMSFKPPAQVYTCDHSGGLMAALKTDAGRAVSPCQESVQSTAQGAGKMASSASSSVSQPSPGAKPQQPATSVSKKSSVSGKEVSPEVLQVSLASSSGLCSSVQDSSVLQFSSSQMFPTLLPSPKADSISQESPLDVRGVRSPPPSAQLLASSSEGTLVTQNPASSTSLDVVSEVGPVQGAPGLRFQVPPALQQQLQPHEEMQVQVQVQGAVSSASGDSSHTDH
ncbi:transcription factor SPT20 homolog [Octodon degus]|uniref:Transcription factor SPT20 homolog n=1 Tax=Octodon degus TaxID=10160 RepID=A0A6P3VB98_OCTDE|nr:transcription factor SPT20 homolog [Octodon degus]